MKVIVYILLLGSISACSSLNSVTVLDRRCRAWDTCPSQGGAQFINIPEGYGGKYCSKYPERC